MNKSRYLVIFKTGHEEMVSATGEAEARILAQAEQIKKGNQYEIGQVYRWQTGETLGEFAARVEAEMQN